MISLTLECAPEDGVSKTNEQSQYLLSSKGKGLSVCVVNYYRNFPSGSDGCFVGYPCMHTLYVRHTEPSTIPSSFQRDSSTQSEMSISGSLKTFTDKQTCRDHSYSPHISNDLGSTLNAEFLLEVSKQYRIRIPTILVFRLVFAHLLF